MRSVVVQLCTDIGYDAATCAPAADLAEASYASCADLVAAGPGICNSVTSVVVQNGQNLGCGLLGQTLGSTLGMASQAIRAFEQEANRANVADVCRCVFSFLPPASPPSHSRPQHNSPAARALLLLALLARGRQPHLYASACALASTRGSAGCGKCLCLSWPWFCP